MMQNTRFKLSALALATAMACSPAAFATNGYFVHGYGTKSNGMGGVAIALPQDSIINATNPSGMSWLGSRADVGIALFNPRRDATLDATGLDGDGPGPTSGGVDSAESGATLFLIPNAGFEMDMAGMTVGFTMFANGGMNTRYNSNIYTKAFGPAIGDTSTGNFAGFGIPTGSGFAAALEGQNPGNLANIDASLAGLYGNPNGQRDSTLGVNLAQLILAPSVSTKIGSNNSVGASLLIGYQRFRAYGLGLFQGLSSSPDHVTNKGDDDAWGAGVRLGWTGKITDSVMLGAMYSSKIYMQKFDQYKGLFAEEGRFDIPANYGIGISLKPSDALTVGFDVERIMYGDVPAIANPGPTADQFLVNLATALNGAPVNALGGSNGYGFGWENQTIYKLGAAYSVNDQWTVRAGVNYGKSPIPNSENLFNIIAPGVVETHGTLGFTYAPTKNNEISVAYMHAFRHDQSYTYQNVATAANPPAGFGPQSYKADIGMSQNSLEVSYGIKF